MASLVDAALLRRQTMIADARALAGALGVRGARLVVLFGSLAEDQAWVGPNSDVDLAVVMPGCEGVRFHLRLATDPAVGAFRHPLDLLVYTPAEWGRLVGDRAFVREEIRARGMVLHGGW